jgi:hypothetical protein
MTASNIDHKDVAAYALGVLNDRESEQFEAHLAGCDICAAELEQLTMVSALLSHVDADSLAMAEQTAQDGQVLDRMLNVVSFQRRRARARRLFAVAAAVVFVFVGVAAGAIGSGVLDRDSSNTPPVANRPGPSATSGPTSGPTAQASPSESERPIGTAGEEFEGTNPTTGVNAKLGLEQKGWGTQVTLQLTNVKGPLKCQLVAVSKNGQNDTAMTWTVPATGYGTVEQPDPLQLEGGTALPRDEIAQFEVRTFDGSTLVDIPV